jgi:predicted nucleic acid-binding protein
MSVVVLDSEAMWSLTRRPGVNPNGALAALTAARENNWDVVVPAAVLAELYRGRRQQQSVDAALSAHSDIAVATTDQRLARFIGSLLAQASIGSEHHVDATVVAAALAAGGGLVVTGDFDDLQMLAAHAPGVVVEPLFV